jgi:hypothetical protein
MLLFAIKYRDAIDSVTADKSLKLRKFELDNDDWKVVQDLVSVLEVCIVLVCYSSRTDNALAIQKGHFILLP